MPYDESPRALMPSLLDRLIDPDSLGASDRPWYGAAQMTRAIQRDLASLLNCRQTDRGLYDAYPECRRSLLVYGFPDLAALEAYTASQRAEIGRRIAEVIHRFEPRLKDVQTTLIDGGDDRRPTLHYLVTARLHVARAPDVAFEVVLELATGQYGVEARDS